MTAHPPRRLADDRERLRDLALTAARAACLIVADSADHTPVATKSSDTDIVTPTDHAAEAAIRSTLVRHAPGSWLLAEESGHLQLGEGEHDDIEWIVDPLDGTVNFAYRLPLAAVSVAAAVAGRPVASAVIDVVHGDEYDAIRGGGARRNGSLVRASQCATAEMALVATGFAYRADRRARHGRAIAELVGRVRDIRAFGSAALNLCWVGDGRLDAYLERDINPWDHAGGALVAVEGGAHVELPCAENDHLIVAANPALHRVLRSMRL